MSTVRSPGRALSVLADPDALPASRQTGSSPECWRRVTRSASADLLPTYITQEMARRNPRMELYEVPGCGHAPTLMTPEQIETVVAFLTAAA